MNMLAVPAAVLLAAACGLAADRGLLGLMMPDAKVIAGLRVASATGSPFGQYVFQRMQPGDPAFQEFLTSTGFDPRRDLTEVVMASVLGDTVPSRWLVAAHGTFQAPGFEDAVLKSGGEMVPFQGVHILSAKPQTAASASSVIAFPNARTAIMGDLDSVTAAILRFQSGSAPAFAALDKVDQVSARFDFWFVTMAPLSAFAGLMPDPNIAQALSSDLFQSVRQTEGGAKFGANVEISAEAITKTGKDAAALVDVVKFITGMLKSNADKNKEAAQFATLLNGLSATADGNVMSMSLSVPQEQIERIIAAMRAPKPPVNKDKPAQPPQ